MIVFKNNETQGTIFSNKRKSSHELITIVSFSILCDVTSSQCLPFDFLFVELLAIKQYIGVRFSNSKNVELARHQQLRLYCMRIKMVLDEYDY